MKQQPFTSPSLLRQESYRRKVSITSSQPQSNVASNAASATTSPFEPIDSKKNSPKERNSHEEITPTHHHIQSETSTRIQFSGIDNQILPTSTSPAFQITEMDTLHTSSVKKLQKNTSTKNLTERIIQHIDEVIDNPEGFDDKRLRMLRLEESASVSSWSDAEAADSITLIMENVVSAYMDPIVVINSKGIIKNLNQAFLTETEFERWEISTKNIRIVIPEPHSKRHDHYLQSYVKSRIKKIIGEARKVEMKRKNGTLIPVLLRVNELRDRDGLAFFAVVRSLENEYKLNSSKELIMSMLPKEISLRMERGESPIVDTIEATSVFVDICDFTKFVAAVEPMEVIQILSRIFNFYDEVCQKYELERIKTIGSIYMAVCGVSQQHQYDHAQRVLDFALELIQIKGWTTSQQEHARFKLRIGCASGKMVAGVMTSGRAAYDIWGDTVNISSRNQNAASTDGITVNELTYKLTCSKIPYLPMIMRDMKGKGLTPTYDVDMQEVFQLV